MIGRVFPRSPLEGLAVIHAVTKRALGGVAIYNNSNLLLNHELTADNMLKEWVLKRNSERVDGGRKRTFTLFKTSRNKSRPCFVFNGSDE